MPVLICLREKLWTRTYSTRDQVPTCPVFTRAKIKPRFGIKVNSSRHNTYYNKDNNAGTAISIINYWKLNPHWGYGNKATEKKTKSRSALVQISYRSYTDNTFLLTWSKAATDVSWCQTKYTVKHILIECIDLAHIRETFYSTNNMKKLFQNIEIKNVMSFLKAINTYGKI